MKSKLTESHCITEESLDFTPKEQELSERVRVLELQVRALLQYYEVLLEKIEGER